MNKNTFSRKLLIVRKQHEYKIVKNRYVFRESEFFK